MCGIVGYVGPKQAKPILLQGLKRLEYRGYDSSGIALLTERGLMVAKSAGKIANLEKMLSENEFDSSLCTHGIAHTRWATHGEPNQLNAHPHTDGRGEIALVHNGIIENYRALKEFLQRQGFELKTETDTEVLVQLIRYYYRDDLTEAVCEALAQVEGTYGIAVISARHPNTIVAARQGSPLVLGIGEKEKFVASDVAAMLDHTNKVIYLDEGEIATITDCSYEITTIQRDKITPRIEEVSWTLDQIEKEGYDHFMLKEIYEQPVTLRNAMRGRINLDEGIPRLGGLNLQYEELRRIKRLIFTACGTSWHAALVGEYLIEELAGIPVEVEYASEFRYRSPIFPEDTILFGISQSGETADTLAAMREAKKRGVTVLGIVNVVGSTIARETDGGVYIHAGPEIGVASTKAFTSQVMAISLIGTLLARMRHLSVPQGQEMLGHLDRIPEQVDRILKNDQAIREIAERYHRADNFLYLGRGINFPVALEGALKLKEISYIHAEGYPAAEMKHGPIALIDENMPVVVIALKDPVHDKVMSNIAEIRARNGQVIAIATEGDTEIADRVNHVIYVPPTYRLFTPLLSVIPLQLLAYHIAVLRGCPVDQPRNLAKSVTVE
ncbi:MAG TPA: glutamine--fructose-6-phosphate transaminase (isomerizing) [candidate division Zixibacteria bacterium]|nr:glutamine--fructose-6-phosphate transaminase (isomerizing) [candidate division Zixibacteria bacterium]MDD4918811.1 glutamine--fructose-6-phosphate transaminase (isomerizing) [candidate division Zixibacteria bacterium]MDM7973616.1 glutamine--fructose-6-phosphate transaminase (isomerizing) [candidate division Zixibacteria bacterium]HPM38628.1 glutamine--fructose-6-phosphate transaminase (isomerizing) [candidate division Zixibacteria bacterium]